MANQGSLDKSLSVYMAGERFDDNKSAFRSCESVRIRYRQSAVEPRPPPKEKYTKNK